MKAHDRAALKWIFAVSRRSRWGVVWLSAVQSLLSFSSVAFALLLRNVIDAAVSGVSDAFTAAFLWLLALILGQIAVRALSRRLEESVRSAAENDLKGHVYRSVITRSYASLAAYHSGELQSRLTGDVNIISDRLATVFPNALAMLVKLVSAAAVLFTVDWRFALVFLVCGPVMLLLFIRMRSVVKRLHKDVQTSESRVRSFMQESIENLLVLKSFSSEDRASAIADRRMEEHRSSRMRKNTVSVLFNAGFGLIMNGGYLLGLLWCGWGILAGTVTYGTMSAVLQLVNQVQSPFVNVSSYLPRFYEMTASAERLMEIDALPPDGAEDAPAMSDEERDSMYSGLVSIDMRDVDFAYTDRNESRVFRGASCSVRKGSFVAITGESGIGKSTFLKLLLAVYRPAAGSLGFELSDGSRVPVSPATRPLFAYVPQASSLLSGTIREAVTFGGHGEPDDARALFACRVASADFVEQLPGGLDTPIGEKGDGLSGGQIQRLAIARALYTGAPVLLLDEATSSLDEDTERRLLENLRSMTDKTVLIVSHRPAALEFCDAVLSVDGQGLSGRDAASV